MLPPERVVLQIDGRMDADSQVLETCDKLVWGGYNFAVESDRPETLPEELLRLAEIVNVALLIRNPAAHLTPAVAGDEEIQFDGHTMGWTAFGKVVNVRRDHHVRTFY